MNEVERKYEISWETYERIERMLLDLNFFKKTDEIARTVYGPEIDNQILRVSFCSNEVDGSKDTVINLKDIGSGTVRGELEYKVDYKVGKFLESSFSLIKGDKPKEFIKHRKVYCSSQYRGLEICLDGILQGESIEGKRFCEIEVLCDEQSSDRNSIKLALFRLEYWENFFQLPPSTNSLSYYELIGR